MTEFSVRVEGTGITLTGDNKRQLELTAQLMASKNEQNGLSSLEAQEMVRSLKDERIDFDLVGVVSREKEIHPSEAASWLLENQNNQLLAKIMRNDEKDFSPPADHTR